MLLLLCSMMQGGPWILKFQDIWQVCHSYKKCDQFVSLWLDYLLQDLHGPQLHSLDMATKEEFPTEQLPFSVMSKLQNLRWTGAAASDVNLELSSMTLLTSLQLEHSGLCTTRAVSELMSELTQLREVTLCGYMCSSSHLLQPFTCLTRWANLR